MGPTGSIFESYKCSHLCQMFGPHENLLFDPLLRVLFFLRPFYAPQRITLN
jgi:hypothetical protein